MAQKRKLMVKVTPEMAEDAIGITDWSRVDAMADEDIAQQAAADQDVAPVLSDESMAAARVRTVRRRLKLTQPAFARRFRVPLGTLRDWEQGRRQPDGPALALLRVIEREPDAATRALAS